MTSALAQAMLALLRAEGIEPSRLCTDSRQVQAGDVFLAYPGHVGDGRHFIANAIERGAAAVLWEREGYSWDPAHDIANVPVDHLRWLVGDIADEVFGSPSKDLWMVGVTGTNGKTSVTQWVARAFTSLGRKCAVVGTLGMGFPGRLEASPNTTPDALLLQNRLAQFRRDGAQVVSMEVSSIGLDQGRINGCRMDIAVLTNLTRDHLDYHHTMEAYAAAKAKLFEREELESVVLNFDDLMGVSLARNLQSRQLDVVGYTLIPDNATAAPARRVLVAESLRSHAAGMRFTILCDGQRIDADVGLVGQFNVSNLLAVVGVLLQSGFSLQDAVGAACELTPPEGRMQTLGGIGEPLVVVDYAHTPDALEQALLALRATTVSRNGELICIFGCGGDRDPGKRPMMGEVAARLAQRVVVTSDNPRSENPERILADVMAGITSREGVSVVIDRAEAIRRTIESARADDVVLLAGKGHETYQEMRGERMHFSDVEHARTALAAWNRAQENPA